MKGYFVFAHGDFVRLRFAYDADAVARIKTIPSFSRSWDADSKMWEMDAAVFQEERDFLFPACAWTCVRDESGQCKRGSGRNRQGSAPQSNAARAATSDYEVLWLRAGAPPEVVKAAYSALIRKHHPDMGGDEEIAKQINAAYARLKG